MINEENIEKYENTDNTSKTFLTICYLWFFSFLFFMKFMVEYLYKVPVWVGILSLLLLVIPPVGPLLSSILCYYFYDKNLS